jgi:TonB family protein
VADQSYNLLRTQHMNKTKQKALSSWKQWARILLPILLVLTLIIVAYRSLHFIFVLLFFIFAILVWWRKKENFVPIVPNTNLFIYALILWIMGTILVTRGYNNRNEYWRAQVNRSFTGLKLAGATDHHDIKFPLQRAERLPTLYDTLKQGVEMRLEFTLLPDGTVQDVTTIQSSGNRELDDQTKQAVQSWRFGALPIGYPSMINEKVGVRIYNNYRIYALWGYGVLFIVLYAILWGVSSWQSARFVMLQAGKEKGGEQQDQATPRISAELLQRLVIVVGLLGGVSWLVIYRLAPDQGNLELLRKQSLFLLGGQSLLCLLPGFIMIGRKRRTERLHTAVAPLATILPNGWWWVAAGLLALWFTVIKGQTNNTEAKLWFPLPFGLSIQTIEVVRFFLLTFLAMTTRRLFTEVGVGKPAPTGLPGQETTISYKTVGWRDRFLPLVFLFIIVFLTLFIMKDLGPAVLLFLFLLCFFCGIEDAKLKRLGISLSVFALLFMAGMYAIGTKTHTLPYQSKLLKPFTHSYERARICLDPWLVTAEERPGMSEQMVHAQWMLSSGGIWGRQFGYGMPNTIDAVESDFVVAALCEEIGVVGIAALLLCVFYVPYTLLQLARRASSLSDQVFVAGVGVLLGLQSILIVAGNLRLLPLTGVTLPFISYGGSSFLVNMWVMGLVIATIALPYQAISHEETERCGYLRRVIPSTGLVFLVVGIAFCGVLLWRQTPFGSQYDLALHEKRSSGPDRVVQNPRLANPLGMQTVLGQILTSDGIVLAETTKARGRLYHLTPALAFVADTLEIRLSETLRGESQGDVTLSGPAIKNGVPLGPDVVLTIDSHLQKEAERVLQASSFNGCVVGLDPRTGAILFAAAKNAEQRGDYWYSHPYRPGSTFKTVVLAAGLENQTFSLTTKHLCPPTDEGISEFGSVQSTISLTASEALVASRNTWFTWAGKTLGWESLYTYTHDKLGFGRFLPILPEVFKAKNQSTWFYAEKSTITPSDATPDLLSPAAKNNKMLAMTGIGQGNVLMSTLHLAAWAGAIANNGQILTPTILSEVRDPRSTYRISPKPLASPVDPNVIHAIRPMMREVVRKGTAASAFADCRIAVAGKTGTAESEEHGRGGKKRNDGLFIGFAPYDTPQIAIAVVQEDIGANRISGGSKAAPIARMLIEATLERKQIIANRGR